MYNKFQHFRTLDSQKTGFDELTHIHESYLIMITLVYLSRHGRDPKNQKDTPSRRKSLTVYFHSH